MHIKYYFSIVVMVCLSAVGVLRAQTSLEDIYIRDPYILTDYDKGVYYLYRSASTKGTKVKTLGGVEVFTSKDLKTWEGPQRVFTVPEDNWITGAVWAPEVHEYQGKYYLFATLNSDLTWKKQQTDWPAYTFRGTQIFYADSPKGPFLPFALIPHTPMDNMALDGTLWVEDGVPYMVYCREWVEIVDGSMDVVALSKDLSTPVGNPMRLFHASAAPWTPEGRNSYVTDGCFLYRTKTDKLLMIWSSFTDNGYAVGIAESTSGKVHGPWKHHEKPMMNENGGHGMLFKTLDGKLCMTLHQPNRPAGAERAKIFEIEDLGHGLEIKGELK